MIRKFSSTYAIAFVFGISMALAQEPSSGSPSSGMSTPVPAAIRSQVECSGFMAADRISETIYVLGGADNDLHEDLREFTPGDFVYLRSRHREAFAVGAEYSLVRPEIELSLHVSWTPAQLENRIRPPSSWYRGQRRWLRSLGRPYQDTGEVKVVSVTPEGAVAQVVFACGPINPGDIAVPYQARQVPEYTPAMTFDRFAPSRGKVAGSIVAADSAAPFLAQGSIAFLNLGDRDGARAGQRYRIFAVFRDRVVRGLEGLRAFPKTPRESVGELVILSVKEKSSVGIVVTSAREIAVGDGVELE